MNADARHSPEIRAAYAQRIQEDRIRNARVACALVVVLMPLGYLMDAFVYPGQVGYLFKLRLFTSAGAALVWMALRMKFWKPWQFRVLCTGWYVVPAFFICCMIHSTDGASSTYYAGLNLVILAVSSVVQATVMESVVAVCLITTMYLAACFTTARAIDWRIFANNATFLFYTISIVITGNYFYNRLRFREFCLTYELERNKQALEESNRKLTELDQIKGRFFANISHELRTPLTLMIAPLETILARYRNALDGDAVRLLQTMQSNGLRLLRLINDLLDLVRLDSGVMQVRREPVALEQFLNGMASAARQVAEEKRIQLVVTIAPDLGAVMVDRDKLEKIALNLQFNALKFTPSGGRVELRADKEGDQLVLRVSDTGIGIPAKDLPNVFGRFFQVDSSARRKFQGVGIGLALVKEFTELHGGTISVQSIEGKGTTFTVRMPFIAADPKALSAPTDPAQPASAEPRIQPDTHKENAQSVNGASNEEWIANLYHRANLFSGIASDATAAAPAASSGSKGSHATVLIADDQPDMLRFLHSELAAHYNVIAVTDGQQAVNKAAEHVPDIILLDMMMPEKDGIQACSEIRAAPATQNVPIILITAHVDEETKINALRAGASDFLPKPFSTTELHVRVKNLIESRHFQRKLAEQNRTLESTIDQLKDTETQLVQTEKLASLGRLSAGIIHEINNPLNFATTGLYTLRNKAKHLAPEQQADYTEILRDVEDGLDRVKIIVSDLRSFTHPDMALLDEVPVAEIVTSALRFVSHEARDRIVIQTQLTDGQTIRGNRNKLIQVVVNLLQNSIDAVAKKTFANGERPTIAITGRVEGGRSLLIVRDNGSGIDPQIIDKVFDPFFTTKDVGEGMGLGLSISYRIVQDCHGQIAVRSEHGKNCEFTLEFPLETPEPAAAQA